MEEAYYSGYLEGLLNMASSESKYIGPSYIKVDCYEKKEFKKKFCKFYKIKEEDINQIETNDSLATTLLAWLGSKEIVENVCYWIDIKNPGDKKVYLTDEKLVNLLDQKKDFYILEDLFFLETKIYIYVFLLGNNE